MLTRQRGHGIDVFNDKLAVRHPQFHVFQIMGNIKARFLHCLIERVKQVLCAWLTRIRCQASVRVRIVAQNQANGLLIGFQRVMGVFPQQTALPLRPQPDGAAKRNQAADDRIDKSRDDELFSVQCQQLQGIYRRNGKSYRRPAVVFADGQIADQGDQAASGPAYIPREYESGSVTPAIISPTSVPAERCKIRTRVAP